MWDEQPVLDKSVEFLAAINNLFKYHLGCDITVRLLICAAFSVSCAIACGNFLLTTEGMLRFFCG